MVERRGGNRRGNDCTVQTCPYAEAIEDIKKEIHGLRTFVEQKMDDLPDRVVKLEMMQGQHKSQIHDCEVDRSDTMKTVHELDTSHKVLLEKLKPLQEQRLWFIALAAMLLTKMIVDLVK